MEAQTEIPPTRHAQNNDRVLRRVDELTWVLRFGGNEYNLEHQKSLVYYAKVLEDPRRSISALTLARLTSEPGPGRSITSQEEYLETQDGGDEVEIGPHQPNYFTKQEIVDPETLQDCERRMRKLARLIQQARENHDDGWVMKYQAELHKLAAYVEKALDTNGKPRTMTGGDPAAKASSAINKAMQRTREALVAISPELKPFATYLRAHVKGVKRCFVYRPDENDPAWDCCWVVKKSAASE